MLTEKWFIRICTKLFSKTQKLFPVGSKNILTGPENCKKTTRHHAHLSIFAKSMKTNDAKSTKWPKPQFGQFF